jgi:hypothetical protein
MNPPHNKLTGRKYSSKPSEGIPLALEIINDKDAHRNDILSAVCYLGYRAIDGTYKDVDFLWPKILHCKEWSLTITSPDPDWFRTRWEVSYLTLSVYFRLVVLKEKEVPTDLMDLACDPRHVLSHPPQFVNVLRNCCLMATHKLFCGDRDEMEKYLKIGIDCYRKSIPNYIIDPNRPDHIIYESGEAVEALNAILEVKYSDYGAELSPKFKSLLTKWKSKIGQESRGPFYKSLLQIYSIHNT